MADDQAREPLHHIDEDEPVRLEPDLPPEIASPLAPFRGASPESTDNTVASVIEESLDGADGLQYYETSSDNLGNLEIAVTFSPSTNAP